MIERKNRRQEIIDAAFAIVCEGKMWSLGEIAKKVGVSKTAIFRHFENRAEIEAAMDAQFCRDLRDAIESAGDSAADLRRAAISFFRAEPGYLFHFMNASFRPIEETREILRVLAETSPRFAAYVEGQRSLDVGPRERNAARLLKNAVSLILASFPAEGIEDLRGEMTRILESGFPQLTIPSDSRLDELEALCRLDEAELRDGNRLFAAIGAAIRERGIEKTTIAQIASRMGMAKSSLYFYCPSKGEMLANLLRNERETMIRLHLKRAERGKTLAEQIFVIMALQANYLLQKPDILPVYHWIRNETIRASEKVCHPERPDVRFDGVYRFDELGLPAGRRAAYAEGIVKWASILSMSAVVQGTRDGKDDARIRESIRLVYKSMLCGDGESPKERE